MKAAATKRLPWRYGHAWATNVALCLIGFGLLMMARQFVAEHDQFAIGFSGVSGWSVWLYLAAIAIVLTQPVNRATFGIILGFGIACRAFTYFAEPFLSSDIYRYVWDGIVQHAHINPFRYVPGDPVLTFLREPNQDVFDNINRRDYAHTIYPPMAQMIYWLVTFFSPTVAAMKAAMFGFECITVGALLAMLRYLGRRREEILLYAWCPLLVWEIGNAGHVDAAVYAFVALALLFRFRGNSALVGLFLGAAILTKFYPLVLVPALYQRRDWKMPAVIIAMTAVCYGVYLSVGMRVFGFLGAYTKEEGMDTGTRYFVLDLAQRVHVLHSLPSSMYLVFCALVLGALTLWAWTTATKERIVLHSLPVIETPMFIRAALVLAFAMMLLFSPHYPWYITWLVPFLVLLPNLPLLTYLCLFFYMFTTALADGSFAKMFELNKILYGAVAAAALLQFLLMRWPAAKVWLRPLRDEQASLHER